MSDTLTKQAKSVFAELDYSFDWNNGVPSGLVSPETVVVSVWVVTHIGGPTGTLVTSFNESVDVSGFITAAWFRGGLVNSVWLIENRITTSAGRKDSRSFELSVVVT